MEKYGVMHGQVVKYHPNGTYEFLTFGSDFTEEQAYQIVRILNSEMMGDKAHLPDELWDVDRQ